MRKVFWAGALFNLAGAFMFAFPGSPLGALAGLPADVPQVYKALVALFVLLYGGMYAYLAQEPVFTRPLIWLGAIGKASAFLCVVAIWAVGEAPLRSVIIISGDLIFAGVFLGWLVGAQQSVRGDAPASRVRPLSRRSG